MKYRLQSGREVTDEDLEEIAKGVESGELPGVSWRGEVKVGRPLLFDEPMDTFSFKVPHSVAMRIKKAAERNGESRSAFLREAAIERAERLLAVL